jgi:hypothetical protein
MTKISLLIQINPLIKLSHWFKFNRRIKFNFKQFLNRKKNKTSLFVTKPGPAAKSATYWSNSAAQQGIDVRSMPAVHPWWMAQCHSWMNKMTSAPSGTLVPPFSFSLTQFPSSPREILSEEITTTEWEQEEWLTLSWAPSLVHAPTNGGCTVVKRLFGGALRMLVVHFQELRWHRLLPAWHNKPAVYFSCPHGAPSSHDFHGGSRAPVMTSLTRIVNGARVLPAQRTDPCPTVVNGRTNQGKIFKTLTDSVPS